MPTRSVGFLLSHWVLHGFWRYRQNFGTSDGYLANTVNRDTVTGNTAMPLGDTFVRQVKPTGKPAGDSYADGGGMYLLVKPSGKYWRMDYRYASKRKTLALGGVVA